MFKLYQIFCAHFCDHGLVFFWLQCNVLCVSYVHNGSHRWQRKEYNVYLKWFARGQHWGRSMIFTTALFCIWLTLSSCRPTLIRLNLTLCTTLVSEAVFVRMHAHRITQEALLLQKDHATRFFICQTKSCQLVHKIYENMVYKIYKFSNLYILGWPSDWEA